MSNQDRAAELLAERFHATYERLAPQFSYRTREASAVPWADVPEANRRLMVATCAEVLATDPQSIAYFGAGLAEGIARAIEDLRDRTTFQDLTLDSPTDTAAYWARRQAFGEAAALARCAGPSVVYPVEPR